VGVYIDNVYYGRVGQTQFDLVDLDHVEVLRGPQGTLFGKNTTAGAINISSRAPGLSARIFGRGDDRQPWRLSIARIAVGADRQRHRGFPAERRRDPS
jgi:outer membrane receptor protein involved in Fe transport